MRVAVVGYGYWGSKHVRVLTTMPDVLVTVVDSDPARLVEAGRVFPTAQLAAELDTVLSMVDAVIVATPPRTHAPIARRAIEAGCHTLVEKPLAASVAECEMLIEAADRAHVELMVGHTFEYNAAVWKLRELVGNGELGNMCYIDTARLNLGRYQQNVNVIWDLAPHDVSIINFLLGRPPEVISAWGCRSSVGLLEDVAYLRLTYTDPDLSAYVHVSWLYPRKVRSVTVVGTEKMAVYDDVSPNERIRIYDAGVTPSQDGDSMHSMPMNYRHGDIVSPYIPFEEPLEVQDGHLIDCIRNGKHPDSDGENGLAVVRVLQAANEALRTGGEVTLNGSGSNGNGKGAYFRTRHAARDLHRTLPVPTES